VPPTSAAATGRESHYTISAALAALLNRYKNTTERDLMAMVKKAAERAPPPGQSAGQPSREELALLEETIRLYLNVAPTVDESLDDSTAEDHAVLDGLAEVLRHHVLGGKTPVVPPGKATATAAVADDTMQMNIAPPGRLPWEILGVDEDRALVQWGVDLSQGKAPNPWKSARLSEESKTTMWTLHKEDPHKYSADRLAEMFRIRQQRAMAILALKEMEEAAVTAGGPEALDSELAEAMEEATGSKEVVGSGERHVMTLPSFPRYKVGVDLYSFSPT
jgi:hypothetical protein